MTRLGRYGFLNFLFDCAMTVFTFGFWLIWVFVPGIEEPMNFLELLTLLVRSVCVMILFAFVLATIAMWVSMIRYLYKSAKAARVAAKLAKSNPAVVEALKQGLISPNEAREIAQKSQKETPDEL